ncbi:MAG: hypothetical protein HS126_00660 [Anaerolineales bacterium]|nr:hypothetical protein [Anaerolineales bacterium]
MTHHTNESVFEAETKDGVQQAKEVAKQAVEQVQHKAQEVAGQAQEQAKSAVASRKDQAIDQLGSVAQAFRTTSNELRNQDNGMIAQYADKVADQVDRISGYLEERDVAQLLGDAENFARRQPELFLGGAFIAGLLVGRFIKSSSERRMVQREQEMALRYQPYAAPENYMPGTASFNQPGSRYSTYSQTPGGYSQSSEPHGDLLPDVGEFDQPGRQGSFSSDLDDDFPVDPRR